MLDIDYCNGKNCKQSKICQRYADYLGRLHNKQSVQYARTGNSTDRCEQFQLKEFYGN